MSHVLMAVLSRIVPDLAGAQRISVLVHEDHNFSCHPVLLCSEGRADKHLCSMCEAFVRGPFADRDRITQQ